MRYQGGKSRIATAIAEVINAIHGREIPDCTTNRGIFDPHSGGGRTSFVSLFCGSCAVESKVTGFDQVILNDRHPYLVALMRNVQAGWNPPENVSEDEYRFLRNNKDLFPALTGFVGFGCSFGGKWFGGYARNAGGTNYAAQSKRSLLKDMATLTTARYLNLDYRAVPIPPGAVVYADPPYAETTGYTGEKFDSAEFWDYARLIAETGHKIFVSEQQAPDGWWCVWEKPFTRTLDRNKSNQFQVTEKLFTWGEA